MDTQMEMKTVPSTKSETKPTEEWMNAARMACIRAFPKAPSTDIIKVVSVNDRKHYFRVNWINRDTGNPLYSRFVKIEDTADGLIVEDCTID